MKPTRARGRGIGSLLLVAGLAVVAACPGDDDPPAPVDASGGAAPAAQPDAGASKPPPSLAADAATAAATDAGSAIADSAAATADTGATAASDTAPAVDAAGPASAEAGGPDLPAPGAPADVTLKVTARSPQDIKLVAFQDGDGPWRALTGAAGVYVGHTTGGRYGFALLCTWKQVDRILPDGVIFHALASEVASLAYDCPRGEAPEVRLTGRVNGIAGDALATAHVTNHSIGLDPQAPTFMVKLDPGTVDVLISRDSMAGDITAFILRKDLRVDTPAMVTFDLAAESKPMVKTPFAVTGLTGRETQTMRTSELVTRWGTYTHLAECDDTCGSLPAAELRPDDLHHFYVDTEETSGTSTGRRTAHLFQRSNAAVELALPAAMPAPVATRSADAVSFTFAARPAAQVFDIAVGSWYVALTTGWLGAGPTLRYRSPDFASLPGWNPEWRFQTGDTWELDAVESNRPVARVLNDLLRHYAAAGSPALDGARLGTAGARGSF
jgi:hypothetical protein